MEADTAEPAAGNVPASRPTVPRSTSDAGADGRSETPVNARKRKKASRACDYCHLNHQPCDNGNPRCGVCEKHNKPCTYLRPTKRRGPQKGYRTALNTYKESAAAWGVVLGAIPGLDALIEGHLRGENGRFLLKSVKDPAQQDALIQRWQQSTVFKTFFPSNGTAASIEGEDADRVGSVMDIDAFSESREKRHSIKPSPSPTTRSSIGPADTEWRNKIETLQHRAVVREVTSLSDIVAKDAARSSSHASQTLAPLGFAPNETIADFYDIGSNPEQVCQPPDYDLDLGTDAEQRVYYELLMGRSFGDSSQKNPGPMGSSS